MTFGSPEWFLLLPACLFIGWFWKSLRLGSPLRLLLKSVRCLRRGNKPRSIRPRSRKVRRSVSSSTGLGR